MTEAFWLVLSLTFSGSLVILVLLALKPLLGRRVSQTWRYYIWAVAALRLLLPFAPEMNLVGGLLTPTPAPAPAEARAVRDTPALDWDEESFSPLPASDTIENAERPPLLPVGTPGDLPRFLGLAWLFVAAMLLVRKLTGYHGYERYLRADSRPVTDEAVLALYRDAALALEVRRVPDLLVSRVASSSMLLGILRPAVIVTEGQLGALGGLPYALRHELVHYRRMDYCFKWLFQIAACVHWFNPLSYLLCREVNRACELSCDEAVARTLDDRGRRAYGSTLLDALEYRGGYGPGAVSMPLCGSAKFMKERLVSIQMAKQRSKLSSALALLLAAGLCCGAVFTGAYAVKPAKQAAIAPAASAVSPMPSPLPKASPAPLSAKSTDAAPVIEGYRVLRDETLSLEGVKTIQLEFGIENVIVLPSQSNTLRFIDYGKTSMTYAAKELVSYELKNGVLTVKNGVWNMRWSNMSSDKWRQKVYLYLPASFGGTLSGSVVSGDFNLTMSVSVGNASFSAGSGSLLLRDVTAAGDCVIDVVSGDALVGAVRGKSSSLLCGSGSIRTGVLTAEEDCAVDVVSGDIVVTGDITGSTCSVQSGSGTLWAGNISAAGNLYLDLVSGDMTLGNASGKDCSVNNGSGTLQMGKVTAGGAVTVDSVSGDCVLDSLSGVSCDILSGSADITLSHVTAQKGLTIDTVSGTIMLTDASASQFSLVTGSGDIQMNALSGHGDVSTVSGDVSVSKLSLTGGLDLEAASGDVTIGLDRSVGVKLEGSSSGSGDIDAFFPLSTAYYNRHSTGPYDVSGQFGSAPYRAITADVISGSIELD